MDAGLAQHRRSRLRALAGALGHALHLDRAFATDEDELALIKRFTAEQLSSYQASLSAEAAASATAAAAGVTTTAGQSTKAAAAGAATIGTTIGTTHTTVANTYTVPTTSSAAVVSQSSVSSSRSSAASSSSAVSSSTSSLSSSQYSAISSSSSLASSSTSSSSSSSSSALGVLTVTSAPSSYSSASSTATIEAINSASVSSDSKSASSLSTGSIVGVALGALVGVVIAGSIIGWFYRKWANRGYISSSWREIKDDLTPFPPSWEKSNTNSSFHNTYHDSSPPADDYYGASGAPVNGSRRALAQARNNAFAADGSFRPHSDYMIERDGNRAGVGAGAADFGGYPTVMRGVDAQGRPYNPNTGRTPLPHTYEEELRTGKSTMAGSPPGGPRQLVGPGAYPLPDPYANINPELQPVALGRPAAPSSYADLMQHEDFDELPAGPHSMPYGYDDQPVTALSTSTTADWPGSVNPRAKPGSAPAQHTRTVTPPQVYLGSPPSYSSPVPQKSATPPKAQQMPLPPPRLDLQPISPLSSSFDLHCQSHPLAMYEDEQSRQKALYGEVARAAGVAEPVTPKTPGALLADSTSSKSSKMSMSSGHTTASTTSSFSAGEPVRLPPPPPLPLPSLTLSVPQSHAQPYQHGQPLSPLIEVATPASSVYGAARSSSSLMQGQGLNVDPFDKLAISGSAHLLGSRQITPQRTAAKQSDVQAQRHTSERTLVPPRSASTTGATSFPSPAFPPPSPSGMSLPGSVSDSPRRWSGNTADRLARGSSLYDEDPYGGI